MKNLLFIITFFVFHAAFAQGNAGSLVEWEVLEKIENLGDCSIEVVKIKDILTGQEKKGVRFSTKYKVTNNVFRHSTILDEDEVDALIKAIPVIQQRVEGRSPDKHKEVYYRSRNGLQVNCFKYNNSWVVVIKVQEQNPESYAYMHRHDLDMLLDFMKRAKEKL